MPFPNLRINLRYFVQQVSNLHLLSSSCRLVTYSFSITYYTQLQCFLSKPLVKINTLSRQAEANLSRKLRKAQLIYLQKVLRAFTNLNRVTSYLYKLNFVQKAVIYSYPFIICSLQKAAVTLSLVYQVAYLIIFNVSLIRGKGYLSFFIRAFKAQQSIQNLRLPLGFCTKRTSKVVEELLTLINSFLSRSSNVQ